MKKTILLGVIAVFALMLTGTLTVECASTLWDLTGSYTIELTCTSVCSGVYPHTMNITSMDMETGDFYGDGYYNRVAGYTWDVSGNVSDSSLTFTITYTGNNPGYYVNATGTIALNGKLSGTASSSSNQTFDWESTTGTCPEGSIQQYVETVSVRSDGSTVTSGVLDNGVTYLFKASGTYTYWPGASPYGIADAEYSYRPASSYGPGWVLGDDVFPPKYPPHSLDINVNGSNVFWGNYNPAHLYTMPFIGTGSTVEFSIYDSNYGDNSGSLTVDIYKCAALEHFLGYKVKTTKVCDGGVTLLTLKNNGPAGNITVTTKDGVVFEPQSVESGGTFEIFGTGESGKLGKEINIWVDNILATTIHTSCSQPIFPGLTFGDFEVVEGESLRGGPLETPALDFFPQDVTLIDQFETGLFKVEKPDKLYNPVDKNYQGINDPNTHLMGYKIKPIGTPVAKPPFHECAPCKGGLTSLTLQYNGTKSAQIEVTVGIENEQLFINDVESGGTFEISGTGESGKLGKEINIWMDNILETTIHTSCSQPIGTGQTFEDFTVIAGESKDGGPICPIIKVESQFGTVFVSIDKADRLLVPTAKSLTEWVDPLDKTGVDHFKGYKIKAAKDLPEFMVMLEDQFHQPKMYVVKKPTKLFVPVGKYGVGIKNPEAHLICYKIKPAEGQLKHVKVLDIYTNNNQFGWLKLDTDKEEELLVPCKKIIQKD